MQLTNLDRNEIRQRYEALDMSRITKEEFDAELQKAYDSMLAGNGKPLEQARLDFERMYGRKNLSYRCTA